MNMKKIIKITHHTNFHWVGDGFPVHNLMSYHSHEKEMSPFLLLDYASPTQFPPSEQQRGVGKHPHRGFETVTIVYQGEVEHQDNAGNAGTIGPGDVQWMTAARGIIHEERHSKEFAKQGGILEIVQLWVNLPAKAKMSSPHYQEILNQAIPVIKLDDKQSKLRVIAGNYGKITGPAQTFTPVHVWDLHLKQGFQINLNTPAVGYNILLVVLKGSLLINQETTVKSKELVFFEQKNDYIALEALSDTTLLVLSGEPIDEPLVGQGPFVMNTNQEIIQAYEDYQKGTF